MDAAALTPSISYYKGGVLSQPETFFMSYQILSFLLDVFHRELYFYLAISIYWSVRSIVLFAEDALLVCRLKWFISSFYLYVIIIFYLFLS